MSVAAPGLTFNTERHEYWLDGQRIPSVTEILRATGVSVDFESVAAFNPQAVERKRQIGTALHADAHAYDDGDLVMESVHEDVRPYLEAWIAFRTNHDHLVPETRERQVYHPTRRYAGTLDGVFGDRERGRLILIDIKTGDPGLSARFQLAAYQQAWEHAHAARPIAERWSVELTPALRVPYRIHRYSARDYIRDVRVWDAIVTTYYAQAARRSED